MQSISVFLDIAKFADFWLKKCCQQNSSDASRDSYIFCIFFRQDLTVANFTIAGCVTDFWEGEPFWSLSIREQLRKVPS